MISEKRPSILRIILTNYVAFIAVLSPVLLWSVFLFEHFQGDRLTTSDLLGLGGFSLVGLVLALWKIFTISTIINYGQEAKATIHSSGFYRSRGRIKFVYTYQGEKYMTQNTVMSNKLTRSYANGDQASIFVNPNNPKNAVLKDIYTK